MTMADFEEALRLVVAAPSLGCFQGPQSTSLIELAERELDLAFTPTYRAFLHALGRGDYYGEEYYGVSDETFTGRLDTVATTRELRQGGMCNDYFVVSDTGTGFYYVIDTSDLDELGEGPVRSWLHEPGPPLASDFGAFFLASVRNDDEFDLERESRLRAEKRWRRKLEKKRGTR